jgi:predicted Zn-dependent protease
MSRVKLVAVVVFNVLAISQAAQAQVPDSSLGGNSITVTVRDVNNKPVSDARVEVRSIMNHRTISGGYTNRAGAFESISVPDGQYEVIAQKGLMQTTDRTDVRAGSATVSMRIDAEDVPGSEVSGSTTVSVAQYKVPKKAREAFKKAEAAVSKRKLDEAQKHIAKALEIFPDFAEALTLRGILSLDAKNIDVALIDLDHAVKADAAYSLAYFALGAAFNNSERFDEALRVLDRGIALAPQSWQGYFEIAKAQIGKRNFEAAIKALDKSESLAEGKYPLIHLLKAHSMLALKNYNDAMTELQTYVDQAPKSPEAESARQTLEQVKAFVAKQ